MPYSSDTITLERIGDIVIASGNVKFNNTVQLNYSKCSETIPIGYRPKKTMGNSNIQCNANGSSASFLIQPNGDIVGLGNPNSAYSTCSGMWITDDDFVA